MLQVEAPAPAQSPSWLHARDNLLELHERAEQLGLVCYRLNKLGGFPGWRQESAVPSCADCGRPMRMLLQIRYGQHHGVTDGTGWLWICESCRRGTHSWQRY